MLPLVDTVIPILCENIPVTEQKKNLEHRLRRSITEILISVLPRDKFLKAVRFFLYHAIISFLRFSGGGWDKRTQQRTSKGARIQSQMRNMCMGYSHVGIRPEVIQRTLADAVDMVLNE